MKHILLAALLALMTFAASARADNGERCGRLFSEQSAVSTCVTLLGLDTAAQSDGELRDKVSQMLYGMSAAEKTVADARRDDLRRETEMAEVARLSKVDQCYRLFSETGERDACKTLRMLTMRQRSDVEMINAVRERIGKAPINEEERRAVVQEEAAHKKALAEAQQERERVATEKQREIEKSTEEMQRQAQYEASRCYRLFSEAKEQEACKIVRMVSMTQYTDKQLRVAVKERLAEFKKEDDDRRALKERNAQAEQRARAALDATMKQGQVGFYLRHWELGGFGNVMLVRFTLQNNTAFPRKDFVIRCTTYGASGTPLNVVQQTLFQSLDPGTRRAFELSLGFVNSQSARAACGVLQGKPSGTSG